MQEIQETLKQIALREPIGLCAVSMSYDVNGYPRLWMDYSFANDIGTREQWEEAQDRLRDLIAVFRKMYEKAP